MHVWWLAELSVAECLAACQHCGFIWSTSALLVPLSPFNESTVARPINTQTLTNALSANTPQVNLSIIECSPSKRPKQTAWDLHAIISISIEEFHHTWVFSAFFKSHILFRSWIACSLRTRCKAKAIFMFAKGNAILPGWPNTFNYDSRFLVPLTVF